ncbi:MAG: rhodanese-like domain-containing protein [Elusimicrobiales bacterium]
MANNGRMLISMAAISLACPVLVARAAEVKYISCDELSAVMSGGAATPIVADVRARADYGMGHIKGAVSAPFNQVTSAGWPKTADIVVYCAGVGCPLSANCAALLERAGYASVRVLKGGYADWKARGYPVEGDSGAAAQKTVCGAIQPAELYAIIKSSPAAVTVLDIRPDMEYRAGHIAGARNAPLEEILKAFPAVQQGSEIVLADRQPSRTQQACEAAAKAGIRAKLLSGGPAVWNALGYPLSAGAGDGK